MAGARVRLIDLGEIELPLLRNPVDFATAPSSEIIMAQAAIRKSHRGGASQTQWRIAYLTRNKG